MSSLRCMRPLFVALALCVALFANAQINQWTYKAHMLTARQGAAAIGYTDGKVYVFGGATDFSGNGIASAEVYDPVLDSWSYVASMPHNRTNQAAVVIPSGLIVLLGGFDGGTTSQDFIAYDPIANAYTDYTGSFPLPLAGLVTAALGADGNIYALITDGSGDEQFYEFAIGPDVWSYLGPAPSAVAGGAQLIAGPDGLLYAIGGESGLTFEKTIYSYNPHTDVWTQRADMGTGRVFFGIALGGDKRVYAYGGVTGILGAGSMTSAESFDVAGNSWSPIQDLQTARGQLGFASDLAGRVYAIGGEEDGGDILNQKVLDTVEVFQPSLINGTGIPFSATEGASFSGNVASFTDADTSQSASDFTATINWGDSTAATVGTVSGSSGSFTVSGSHTYAEAGSYIPFVAVFDADGEQVGISTSVNVTDAVLTADFVTFSPLTNVLFSGKIATFTDANPAADKSDFSATVDWGDGFSTGTLVTADPSGGFDVFGSHSYVATGSKAVKVTINDTDGTQIVAQGSVNVTEPSPSVTGINISGVEGAQFSGNVASFTDADIYLAAGSFSATIAWGDGVSTSGVISSNGSGGFYVSGSHTYLEEGSYSVGVTVNVTGGSPGSGSSIGSVSDAPLTATGFNLSVKGTIFSGQVATFHDGDPNGVVSDFTASIAWGDGGHSNGTITFSGGAFHVTGSHAYAKKGKYVVTIFIGDVGGSSTSTTTNINAGPVK